MPLAALIVAASLGAVWSGGPVTGAKNAVKRAASQTAKLAPKLPPSPPLPPPPPLSVADSLGAMQIVPGFKIECIASEPAVEAPVAMTFDEDGRLWVVEMRSYMPDIFGTGEKLPTNRISVLEDRDGDGVFETSRVFLDDLMLPRGVAPCFGGALVLEPPNLYICKDTDGDGKADVKTKLLDGFAGIENPEHAGNGLMYGIDNWYHFSQHKVDIHFDGEKIETRATPVHGQWGITQDDRGRLYYTPNSTPLLVDVFPKYFGARNSNMSSVAGMGENIAPEAGTTWPIHATPGVNRGYQEGILRPDRTLASLTAACGPSLYRAELFGPEFYGDAFICEPAGTLVKRLKMTEKNGLPHGENAYKEQEFVASRDERFRPVNSCIGPDGALYICDMYRGVIQHKTYLTDYLKDQIKERKLETPLNMGRIYRIAPVGFTPKIMPKLSTLSDEMLVELLSHKDGWYRDTAQRLLVQRKQPGAIARLRELLASGEDWRVKLHALWTLDGLGGLSADDLKLALAGNSPALLAASAEIIASHSGFETFRGELLARGTTEKDVTARATIAAISLSGAGSQALHEPRAPRESDPVYRAIASSPDSYTRDAFLSQCKGEECDLLARFIDPNAPGAFGIEGWPKSQSDKRMYEVLTACIFRAGDKQRLKLAEMAAGLAADNPARALLIKRIASEQRLEADEPRVMKLAGEPKRWVAAAADTANSFAADFAATLVYFDWPGRPPIKRPKKMRELTTSEADLFAKGEVLYGKCSGCHQPEGEGAPGQAPPLVAAKILTGRAENAIKVLLQGLEGEYTYGESTYSGSMPVPPLEGDKELAAVLTYCRRSFGNVAEPVKTEDVTRIRGATRGRNKAWTREELK